MDELDKFVQDGVFEQHAHTQLFEQGETSEARERWLQNVKSICREAGIGYVVREITKDGKPGYQFGFADSSHHAAFVLNVCGDRYRFAVGFGACLITGKTSLLPPSRWMQPSSG